MAPVTWDSASILSTIRRPWRVFEEDLEDKLADAGSQNLEVLQEARDQLAALQAKGAKAAFSELPEEQQRMYAEVSLTELAAFVCFQRKKAAQQLGATDEPGKVEALWDTMPLDEKAEWCPEDPRAVLSQESKWANLLADGPVTPTPAPAVVPTPTPVMKREADAARPAPETKVDPAAAATKPPVIKSEKVAPATAADTPPVINISSLSSQHVTQREPMPSYKLVVSKEHRFVYIVCPGVMEEDVEIEEGSNRMLVTLTRRDSSGLEPFCRTVDIVVDANEGIFKLEETSLKLSHGVLSFKMAKVQPRRFRLSNIVASSGPSQPPTDSDVASQHSTSTGVCVVQITEPAASDTAPSGQLTASEQ
eukprot:TRINITY_DN14028_c0_g2_i2.p1 TRINITY_DN14028_c0_g2~~TRINITY_DN14028_c0_g2_i2.p1  ORF type:complete len:364 (-),score=89.82 TRINITY_DN14028_c0_g2_i2:675-1766(-)